MSPVKACLLHLFLRAIATALFAAFCPITYRSNSETISLGDKDETIVCYVTGNGLKATESIMQVLTKPEVMQADVAKISAVVM